MLLLQDVQGVIYGDNAQQSALIRDNGHGQQVVLCDVLCHVLLVILGAGGLKFLGGNVIEAGVGVGHNESS